MPHQIVTTSSTGLVSVLYNPFVSSHGALLPLAKMGRTAPRNIDQLRDTNAAPIIMTPHALPMFKDADRVGGGGKRQRERDRNDAVKTMKPTVPVHGVGSGGRVGASEFSPTQFVCDGSRRRDGAKPRRADLPLASPRLPSGAQQHLLRAVIKDNTMGEDVRRPSLFLPSFPPADSLPPPSPSTPIHPPPQPREALLKYASDAALNPVWAGAWADQPKIFRNIEDEVGGGEEEVGSSKKNKKPRTGDKDR